MLELKITTAFLMLGRGPLDLLQNKFTAMFYCLYRHAVLELQDNYCISHARKRTVGFAAE